MHMSHFSSINHDRSEYWHKIDSWSLSDWMTALVGEIGEAANIIKKLNRDRDKLKIKQENRNTLQSRLEDELADAFIYLDLVAQRAGIDLETAVINKFNKTSRKNKLAFKIVYKHGKYEFVYPTNLT